MKKSHEDYLIYMDDGDDDPRKSLRNYLQPTPIKPNKNNVTGITNLDPTSSL